MKQHLRNDSAKAGKPAKQPTAAETKAAIKSASERQARLSLIANILRGPSRDRYDHFLTHGFPLWKGTDYYYTRYRPGLGTVMLGVFVVGGGVIHYLILYMNWKRQQEFVGRYVKFAREKAWGGNLGIPTVVEAAPAPAPPSDDDTPPPVPVNRKQRRMQEKGSKREDGGGRPKKKGRKAQAASRETPSGTTAPSGVRKRVVAENGKILVVDSLGDVFLEEEDEEGNVNEYLLDVSPCPGGRRRRPADLDSSPTSSTSPPLRIPPSSASPCGSSIRAPAASRPARQPRRNRTTAPTTRTPRSPRRAPTRPGRTLRCSTRAPTHCPRPRPLASSKGPRPTRDGAGSARDALDSMRLPARTWGRDGTIGPRWYNRAEMGQ